MPDGLSIQETYYPALTCFGCGHANERGLHLRSYEVDGVVQATFTPWQSSTMEMIPPLR